MPELLVTEAAFVQPGDVLILRIEARLTMAQAERIKEALLAKMPGLADVVTIGGVDQLAVYRPHQTQLAGDDASR